MKFQSSIFFVGIVLSSSIFIFISCKKNNEEERTNDENRRIESFITTKKWEYTKTNNIYQIIRIPAYGYNVSLGDAVSINYSGYTLDGKVFDTNVKDIAKKAKLDTVIRSFRPLEFVVGESNLIEGLNSGLVGINEGDSATIIFPSSIGFGGNAFGTVESWSPLAYDIKLIKVNNVNIQKEISYISSLNLTAVGYNIDASGLFYKFELVGIGNTPAITDTIYGWYKGTLSNGAVFDEVVSNNKQIVLASKDLPDGLKLGFMLTKQSGITELVLPSYLGFGNDGKDVIKPYETIRYRIRFDSIK